LIAWENLVLAAKKARRGKRDRGAVRRFEFGLEPTLLRLARELEDGHYLPGAFTTHRITRPKTRLISAAPFRDRVVHHALMNVLEPIFERRFHPDSYACRKDKGTHAAARRLQSWMGRRTFALQCDIAQFFPSIDHQILKVKLRRLVADDRVLWLTDQIIDHSNPQDDATAWFPGDDLFTPVERRRGLPIGNLTSQWLANLYLDDLDHFVTSHLGLGAHVRYCDDFVVLSNNRQQLQLAAAAIRRRLVCDRLKLHESKLHIRPVQHGLTFVGYRIWAMHRLLRKENVRAMRRRVRWMQREYASGSMDFGHVRQRIASWIGHARQADSVELINRLSQDWVFVRSGAPIAE